LTIQDLGSIGELIAAIATIATLAYLAVQVRQNTRALRSSTFQDVAGAMSSTTETISTHPELAAVMQKASEGLAGLTAEERVQYHFLALTVFRRLETVYIQRELGVIEPQLTEGFERSGLSILTSGGGLEWWQSAKGAFSAAFASHVDLQIRSGKLRSIHPGVGNPR
jgi:hypothetical protein